MNLHKRTWDLRKSMVAITSTLMSPRLALSAPFKSSIMLLRKSAKSNTSMVDRTDCKRGVDYEIIVSLAVCAWGGSVDRRT